ncbi:Hypothetical predicted protein [Lecanosticta acicola]|uniref:Uncharacterized protein n=1 Tax=Lecanosticta acicola TaxID=111012 RepID=A0AAI8Z7T9_9PEZI|nr:Hypothetical predicted protein [Lecanosticta acicola]
MFVEDRPLSTFRPTSGWLLPSPPSPPPPQPQAGAAARKRPPISSSNQEPRSQRLPLNKSSESSSSLSGLERPVPSFQSFIQKTPSVELYKPLPPTPPPPRKRSEGSLGGVDRRASSVYSRTSSQSGRSSSRDQLYEGENDYAMVFRPVSYSTGSSGSLNNKKEDSEEQEEEEEQEEQEERPAAADLLDPRAFSPLLASPSPIRSAPVPTNPPPLEAQTSAWSISAPTAETPVRSRVPTVSLEQAQRSLRAPGAVHLLPEELRAQRLGSSQGSLRMQSMEIFNAGAKAPASPNLPKLLDVPEQGDRGASGTADFAKKKKKKKKVNPAYGNAFHVGEGPVREMTPCAQNESDTDEPRGRTMQRRSQEVEAYQLSAERYTPIVNSTSIVVTDYSPASSSGPYRQASSPSPAGYSTDDSVTTHLKMVPQPLFQGKQPPLHARTMSAATTRGSETGSSVSPFSVQHQRVRSNESTTSSRRSSSGFGLRLSVEPPTDTTGRSSNHSSTGVIPISPPTDHCAETFKRLKPPKIDEGSRGKSSTSKRREKSQSHFYPHIMARNGSKPKKGKGSNASANPPPLPTSGKPLLPAEVVAQVLKTPPESSPQSPLVSHPISPTITTGSSSRGSSVKAARKHGGLLVRIANRARRRSSQQQRDSSPPRTSPDSRPRLFPSPSSKSKMPLTSYLGWSDVSKRDFDEAHSAAASNHEIRPTHITAPAKPLETGKGEQEPESPSAATTGRRPSLFVSVLDGWRESKAQKRREDLKKMIRVVAPTDKGMGKEEEKVTTSGSAGSDSPGLLGRRFSSYGWM